MRCLELLRVLFWRPEPVLALTELACDLAGLAPKRCNVAPGAPRAYCSQEAGSVSVARTYSSSSVNLDMLSSGGRLLANVDDERGMIVRPPGLMLDTGGTGKGLCADAVAFRLGAYSRFVVDCGGDIAIGGIGAELEPYRVQVEHPLTGRSIGSILVARGGVATSGLNVRIWRDRRGRFAHHLLDPSTGAPAWTGLISATALGSTALEAETLSKLALLFGPVGAR